MTGIGQHVGEALFIQEDEDDGDGEEMSVRRLQSVTDEGALKHIVSLSKRLKNFLKL